MKFLLMTIALMATTACAGMMSDNFVQDEYRLDTNEIWTKIGPVE